MSFNFEFTADKLKKCLANNKACDELFVVLEKVLPKYEIHNKERVAAFLAQCGHESVDFTKLKENLNYSAKGLHATWPKRFISEEAAKPYERNPEKIANRVYGDRMGNGPEASGDGWKYRGRGAIQLTGKDNYTAFSRVVGKNLNETIDYLDTLEGAIESACWFWKKNNLNAISDTKDMDKATRVINGGTLGLAERKQHFEHNLSVL